MLISEFTNHVKKEMQKVIIGQDNVIEQVVLAFLAGGHVILEGVPGLAKTILARTFSKIINAGFNRIQFTPDLMPSDILGTNIFNLKKSGFVFKKGPVFTNILLADEINRTSPKTQAALLEIMQEKQVTIDGLKYKISLPFMVLATQNPIEFEGTYPLPEAQLDRFLMKVDVKYPERNSEIDVLKKFRDGFDSNELDKVKFKKVDIKILEKCKKEFLSIKVEDKIVKYIMDIIQATREHKAILLGVSTRAAICLLNIARYHAGLDNRRYVIPDDIKNAAAPVLRHRIILQADAEIEGYKNDDIIKEIIENQKVPR